MELQTTVSEIVFICFGAALPSNYVRFLYFTPKCNTDLKSYNYKKYPSFLFCLPLNQKKSKEFAFQGFIFYSYLTSSFPQKLSLLAVCFYYNQRSSIEFVTDSRLYHHNLRSLSQQLGDTLQSRQPQDFVGSISKYSSYFALDSKVLI